MSKFLNTELNELSSKDISPYTNNEKYNNLLVRLLHSKINDTDEFIISEAIKIYSETDDNNLKIRILELLEKTNI